MSLVTDLASLFESFGFFLIFFHYFLVSLPSYCLDFNSSGERSLLEIVLYCISKLAVYFGATGRIFQNWRNIGPRGYPQPSFQITLTDILQFLLFDKYDQHSQQLSKYINKSGFFPRIAQVDVLGHGFGITFRVFWF